MTATYSLQDNTLTEQPTMEKPDSKDYQKVVHRPFGEIDCFTDNKYYEDLKGYEVQLAKCRTLVCSPECRGLWAAGQKLEEGKDYEVRGGTNLVNGESCWTAFPLPVKSEEVLWEEVMRYLKNETGFRQEYVWKMVDKLKSILTH